MIIRFNGGVGGIKEYLEKGQTKERFYDRDQLDERVILAGNLNTTDSIIKQIDDSGQKYYHVTLAFKEDNISNDTLKEITTEFKDFFLKAYSEDEIHFYAEAHLPKLKSYHDKSTGDLVERKPHIHIVIPQVNLLSKTKFGFPYDKYVEYVDAFQEYINCKYGLQSPKENRREGFNKHSEIVSRYKGDAFQGSNSELKKQLFDKLIESKVSSFEEFEKLLKEDYAVRLRNEGKADRRQYLNVKTPDMARGVNLKEYVFSREFLEKPLEEKLSYFEAKHLEKAKYLEVGAAKPIDEHHLLKLQEWNSLVAYQEKYINIGGSKKDRLTFKNLDFAGRQKLLRLKEDKFYSKHLEGAVNESRAGETEYTRTIRAYSRSCATYEQSAGIDSRIIEQIAGSAESIGRSIKAEVIRRRAADIGADSERTIRVYSGEREVGHNSRASGDEVKHTGIDELICQNNSTQRNKNFAAEINQLKKTLTADVLLELVARTHGVVPEKYLIVKGADGSDRIKCGERNLTLPDFLTQELNLRFNEALPLLKTAAQMQEEITIEMGYDPQEKLYLFDKYKKWLVEYKTEKEKEYSQYKLAVKEQRLKIRNEYRTQVKEIRKQKNGFYHEKEQQARLLKMKMTREQMALNEMVGENWEKLRSKYNLEMQNAYRLFLAKEAQDGDQRALQELRRLRVDFESYTKSGEIRHVDRYQEYRLDFDYSIDKAGTITYTINGQQAIKDLGKRVDVLLTNDDTLSVALNLAVQKFGKKIELHGDLWFRQQVIEYAVANNYKLEFKDEYSRNYHSQVLKQIKEEGLYKQIYYREKHMLVEIETNSLNQAILAAEKEIKTEHGVDSFVDDTVGQVLECGEAEMPDNADLADEGEADALDQVKTPLLNESKFEQSYCCLSIMSRVIN